MHLCEESVTLVTSEIINEETLTVGMEVISVSTARALTPLRIITNSEIVQESEGGIGVIGIASAIQSSECSTSEKVGI